MARLLTILIVGLICEAIGVVFLSRGLKEIIWFFSIDDIRDAGSLATRLSTHPDPMSAYVWERLTAQEQARLTGPESSPEQRKRSLAEALNAVLPDGPIYDEHRLSQAQ